MQPSRLSNLIYSTAENRLPEQIEVTALPRSGGLILASSASPHEAKLYLRIIRGGAKDSFD